MEIHLPTMIAQILTFIVAVAIVWKFAWKQLLVIIQKRQESITSAIDQAERTRLAVAKLEEEYLLKLDQIQQKSNELIGMAKLEGTRAREEIVARAKEEAEQIRKKAMEQLEVERRKLADELRAEVVRLSVGVAERACREFAGKEEQKRRFEEMLAVLESGGGKERRS